MSLPEGWSRSTAVALQEDFDRSFTEPAGEAAPATLDFLAIEAGSQAYVVSMTEVAGLYVDRKVVAVPGPVGELLGVAAFRGVIVPVFSLPALLGHGAGRPPRWILLAGGGEPVGLAFEAFLGHRRVAATEVSLPVPGATRRDHVSGILPVAGTAWLVLQVTSILEAVRRLARRDTPSQER